MTLCICSAKGSSMTAEAWVEMLPCNEMGCQARFVMQDTSLPTPETFPFLLSQAPVSFHASHPIPVPLYGLRMIRPLITKGGDGGVGAWAGKESSPQY